MNLRKNIATVGLATLLALPSCVSSGYNYEPQRTEEQVQADEQRGREMAGLLLGVGGSALMGKAIQQGNPGGYVYGRGVRELGRNLAQNNQPTVQQNFYGNQQGINFSQQLDEYYGGVYDRDGGKRPPASFTCTSFRDNNTDGFIEEDELNGLRSYFSCKEKNITTKIVCGAVFDNVRGMKITGIIKDGKTGTVYKVVSLESKKNNQVPWLPVEFTKTDDERDKGIYPYTVEWMVNGRILPTRTINFFIDYGD